MCDIPFMSSRETFSSRIDVEAEGSLDISGASVSAELRQISCRWKQNIVRQQSTYLVPAFALV